METDGKCLGPEFKKARFEISPFHFISLVTLFRYSVSINQSFWESLVSRRSEFTSHFPLHNLCHPGNISLLLSFKSANGIQEFPSCLPQKDLAKGGLKLTGNFPKDINLSSAMQPSRKRAHTLTAKMHSLDYSVSVGGLALT